MKNSPWQLTDTISAILFIAMHLSILFVFFVPFSWWFVLLALVSYFIRMWSITAGYHRYFAHRSYKTSRAFQFFLGLLGTSSMQNGPLWWASVHRDHHKYSDTERDPHSPVMHGFWHAQIMWFFKHSINDFDISNVNDLKRYPELRWLDAHRWIPIVGYAIVCFLIAGLAGVVWGFVIPTLLSLHATSMINSLAHLFGKRRYDTEDSSRNNIYLALLTLGEGWHNNHHHYMSAARQGFFWWEIDVSYYTLKVLEWFGIVWDMREPPAEVVADKIGD